jgi:hypothetical protein
MSMQMSLFDLADVEMPIPAKLTDKAAQGFIRCEQQVGALVLVAIDVIMWAKDEDYDTAQISWRDAKTALARDESQLVEKIYTLKAKATDGKMRETDGINQEQLYRLALELPGKKTSRFKDAVAYILTRLSQEALKHSQNITAYVLSGYAAQWAQVRVEAKETQKVLNSGLVTNHENHDPDMGMIISQQNHALFEMNKSRIIEVLGLTPKQAATYRDFLGKYALKAVILANEMATDRMRNMKRTSLDDVELCAIVLEAARYAAEMFRGAARFVGEDYLSGDPVDKDGKRIREMQPKLIEGK